jgi:hypothetical protein
MHFETPQSRCRAGVARGDITPPVGIYHRMWGAATHDRSTGIHRHLTATALAMTPRGEQAQGQALMLLAVDHCLLWGREMDEILSTISQATGLAKHQIQVMFSHTHGAGLMGLERAELPGGELIPTYLKTLGESLAELAGQALARLQEAMIVYGTGRCALAAHRDTWDEDSGQYVCGFHPNGPADDTVLVARISDDHGKVLATMVNYACHPTTLAWDNTLISPDYPGAMREVIELATAAPCVFIQGASGDLGPREGFVGDTSVADRNGRQLGHAALAALEALLPAGTRFEYAGPVVSGATIGTWRHRPLPESRLAYQADWSLRYWTIDLDYRSGLRSAAQIQEELQRQQAAERAAHAAGDLQAARDCRAQAERMTRQLVRLSLLPPGTTFPFPITLLRLGDAIWIWLESEHYQVLQTALRRRFPDVPIVVATVVNGSAAHTYLPTREAYDMGIYQETIALFAAGCLERLIDELKGAIAGLVAKQ